MGETRCVQCVECGITINDFMGYAFKGNIYCPICKPEGAQSMMNICSFESDYGPDIPIDMTEEECFDRRDEAERIYERERLSIPYKCYDPYKKRRVSQEEIDSAYKQS